MKFELTIFNWQFTNPLVNTIKGGWGVQGLNPGLGKPLTTGLTLISHLRMLQCQHYFIHLI